MKLPGRNQWIMIAGGLTILTMGLVAAFNLPEPQLASFLDFAGSFGWKALVGMVTISGTIKVAGILKNGKQPEE